MSEQSKSSGSAATDTNKSTSKTSKVPRMKFMDNVGRNVTSDSRRSMPQRCRKSLRKLSQGTEIVAQAAQTCFRGSAIPRRQRSNSCRESSIAKCAIELGISSGEISLISSASTGSVIQLPGESEDESLTDIEDREGMIQIDFQTSTETLHGASDTKSLTETSTESETNVNSGAHPPIRFQLSAPETVIERKGSSCSSSSTVSGDSGIDEMGYRARYCSAPPERNGVEKRRGASVTKPTPSLRTPMRTNSFTPGTPTLYRKRSLAEKLFDPANRKSVQLIRKNSLTTGYFTVIYDFNDGEMDLQTVPAIKGLTLGQAIMGRVESWSRTLDCVSARLPCFNQPLSSATDCYTLNKAIIYVRGKDGGWKSTDNSGKNRPRSLLVGSGSEDSYLQTAVNRLIRRQASDLSITTAAITSPPTSCRTSAASASPSAANLVFRSSLSVDDTTDQGSNLASGTTTSSCSGSFRGSTETLKGRTMKGPSRLHSLFSSPFNKTQDKHEQLTELLSGYSLHGLPKMPDLYSMGRPHYDLTQFHLERHWSEIVADHESMSKRQRDQQEAIWELLVTEVEYIRKLRVIIELFLACLLNIQHQQILTEIHIDRVFGNIIDVYYATCHFWCTHLSQCLKQARRTKEPLNPSLLKTGFLVFDKIFEPYTQYCLEQEMCREYIKTKMKESDLFRTFVMWAESQIQCNRLKLVDLIVRPWQRLTKYRLLLYAMRKHTDRIADSSGSFEEQRADIRSTWGQLQKPSRLLRLQDLMAGPWQRLTRYRMLLREIMARTEIMLQSRSTGPGIEPWSNSQLNSYVHESCLQNMIEEVERFVQSVNTCLSQRQDCNQLLHIISRIDSYDAVEAPSEECIKLTSDYCKLDLSCPMFGCGQQEMRCLLLEGNLKLKDAYCKMDVYCFLFTDMLLLTKPLAKKGDKVKVIKPPMRLDKIVLYGLRDFASFLLLYLNEFHVAQSIYTLHGDSKLWIEAIRKAQRDYHDKRNQYMTHSDSLILDTYDDTSDITTTDDDYTPHRPLSAEPRGRLTRQDSLGSIVEPGTPSTPGGTPYLNPGGKIHRSLSFVEISGAGLPQGKNLAGSSAGHRAGRPRPSSAAYARGGASDPQSPAQRQLPLRTSSAASSPAGGVSSPSEYKGRKDNYLTIPQAAGLYGSLQGSRQGSPLPRDDDSVYGEMSGDEDGSLFEEREDEISTYAKSEFDPESYRERLNMKKLARRKNHAADRIKDLVIPYTLSSSKISNHLKSAEGSKIQKRMTWNSEKSGRGEEMIGSRISQSVSRASTCGSDSAPPSTAPSSSGFSSSATSLMLSHESETEENNQEQEQDQEQEQQQEHLQTEKYNDNEDDYDTLTTKTESKIYVIAAQQNKYCCRENGRNIQKGKHCMCRCRCATALCDAETQTGLAKSKTVPSSSSDPSELNCIRKYFRSNSLPSSLDGEHADHGHLEMSEHSRQAVSHPHEPRRARKLPERPSECDEGEGESLEVTQGQIKVDQGQSELGKEQKKKLSPQQRRKLHRHMLLTSAKLKISKV